MYPSLSSVKNSINTGVSTVTYRKLPLDISELVFEVMSEYYEIIVDKYEIYSENFYLQETKISHIRFITPPPHPHLPLFYHAVLINSGTMTVLASLISKYEDS